MPTVPTLPSPLCALSIPCPSRPPSERLGTCLGHPKPVSGVWLTDPHCPARRTTPPNLEAALKWSCGEEMRPDLEASRTEPGCSAPVFRARPPSRPLFFVEVPDLLLKHNILVLSFLIC